MSQTQKTPPKKQWFTEFARITSVWSGSPLAFSLAAGTIVVWLVSGPVFHYSDTWQLVINTGTTIVTFLMVFLIQNSQNRDGKVIQLKLDELIRALEGAETGLIEMDNMCEEDLEALRLHYSALAQKAGHKAATTRSRKADSTKAKARPAAKATKIVARKARSQTPAGV
ncbi:low affinity iron permease family protein [Asticcacaulis sp. EMRT-3]|uniref:low affinity iron permease family protein n=1 Tax=Asticcacaulis sp. EMRT-3 TaxID=3040349 RepID=UPI0024AF606A|nr:low affinity iron permease family protein [Asticcacaulis sp. EMRT-3]MDI7776375.1 low affinity iron permease family protein [Asticcacaulis sp. EMRT-3]